MKFPSYIILASSTWALTQAAAGQHRLMRRVEGYGIAESMNRAKSKVMNSKHEHEHLRHLQEGEPGPLQVGDEFETRISLSGYSEVSPIFSGEGARRPASKSRNARVHHT